MTFNSTKISLPKSVTIKLRDKFKIRHIMKREPLLFHMLRQGFNWFTLASNDPSTELYQLSIDIPTDYGL